MLKGIIDFWFLFVALSVAFTAYDIRNTPVSIVQKIGWLLVILYTGPFGLFFYLLSCRSPGPGMHDMYTHAMWKQAVNSEVHCVAGDATGIIIAAIFLSYFVIPNGVELLIEYIAAFITGWVIFQAGMMVSMYSSYKEALVKTFFAEATSMNMVMVGMIPTMVILMHNIPESRDPSNLHFWFVMGMATLAGSIIAYPMNYWLVKNKLKHGCMTLPEKTSFHPHAAATMHSQHAGMHHGEKMSAGGHGHDMHMAMNSISFKKQNIIVGATLIALIIAVIITLFFAPIRLM